MIPIHRGWSRRQRDTSTAAQFAGVSFGDHLARIANDSLKLVREQVEFHIDWLHIFSGRAHLVLNGDLVKRKLVRHDDMFCVSSMKKGYAGK